MESNDHLRMKMVLYGDEHCPLGTMKTVASVSHVSLRKLAAGIASGKPRPESSTGTSRSNVVCGGPGLQGGALAVARARSQL